MRRAVRAGLDGRAAIAGVEHLAEQALQVDRLGRRERRGASLAADLPLDRPDEARRRRPRHRESRAAGTPSSSSRSSPSRRRARAPSSARRRTRPRPRPSTRGPTGRRAVGHRPRAIARPRPAAAPRSIASHARSWPSTALAGDAEEERAVRHMRGCRTRGRRSRPAGLRSPRSAREPGSGRRAARRKARGLGGISRSRAPYSARPAGSRGAGG